MRRPSTRRGSSAAARLPALGAMLLAVLVAALGAGCAAPGAGTAASRPATASELAAAVTIYRDTWGVPHVYGPTDESVAFGWVYAQAEDNFWQIEDTYIQALGRSAEVYGEDGVQADLLNRALEIPRLSREEYERSDDQVKRLAQAAAAALNHYLAKSATTPRLLATFEPWHVMAYSRFATFQQFIFGRAGLSAAELLAEPQPLERAARRAEPPGTTGPRLASAPALLEEAGAAAGSNTWAVSPSRSESGKALLFINPHQPYFGPGQWYEGHVHSEQGLHFSGAGFFGSPLPTIGHNEHLGWSHTVNAPDILDVYRISFDDPDDPLAYRYGEGHRQAVAFTDTIAVKTASGVERREYSFRKTHHGPIVARRDGVALAVRMAKFEEGGLVRARYEMARSKNLVEFRAALARLATPMFNTMYADREGNIFYLYNGAVPIRDPQRDWSQPVDGSDPGNEWAGYHPLEDLPQITNPTAGYLQNCNATPFLATAEGGNPLRASFPPYMVSEDDNARSRISRRLLEAEAKFSLAEWTAAAWDTTVIEAEVWIPKLRAALAASPRATELQAPLALLLGWDGRSTVESTAMALFFTWRDVMVTQKNEDLVDSFARAVAALTERWGSFAVPWGEVNRLQRRHTGGKEPFDDAALSVAVAGGPGPLGIVFNFYTRAQDGAKRRYGVAGHSFVSVVEFGDPVRALSLLQFGQSADPRSPHYFDQARLFAERRMKPAWFTLDEVKADAQRVYHPGEAGT